MYFQRQDDGRDDDDQDDRRDEHEHDLDSKDSAGSVSNI